MTSKLTSSHLLVLCILSISILSSILSSIFLSGIATLAILIFICSILWLLRPLILPPGIGATRVRIFSLVGIFSLAGFHSLWGNVINSTAKALSSNPYIVKVAPWISEVELMTEPSIAVLIFVSICVLIINYFMADRTIAGDHPIPLKKDFPEPSFQSKLDSFCSALRQHLETTDRQTNWSPDYYTELEAEVEIIPIGGISGKKRILDLQTALRSERRTQAFLILGDPGGGKSVALRKLARDMLMEVNTSGRVPLYINLREWLPAGGRRVTAWTEQQPPSILDLESFVIKNIKARGDVFTEDFVDTYFRDLWQHGRLFFIFDSFDEIPELLDMNEDSWLINHLSDLLSRFISTNINARGILASRVFRHPTQSFLAQKILDIRPMSEERIVLALARYKAFTQDLQNQLFRDRHDLVPIARNPFLMALLGEWVNNHRALPLTQGDLYKDYLENRLLKAKARIIKHGLTENEILNSAIQIAFFVFNSSVYGLEAPVSVLKNENSIKNANETIDILSYCRIARVSAGDTVSFAFVHRRFLEYLVTTRLLAEPKNLPLDHIPTDSRGRDAMVLYAQLCDEETAKNLAQLCWKEICDHFENTTTQLRAIHSLRFLIDAFRSRRSAVSPFTDELDLFINRHANGQSGLIQAKICLEATGLLNDISALPILQYSIAGENSWLRETAFRACRHLPKISPELQNLVNDYVRNMPIAQFWEKRRPLIFSLSLSDSLKETYRIAVWRKWNIVLSSFSLIIGGILAPFLALLAALWTFIPVLMESFLFPVMDRLTPKFISKKATKKRKPVFKDRFAFPMYQHSFGILLILLSTTTNNEELPKEAYSIAKNGFISMPLDIPSSAVTAVIIALGFLSFDWLFIISLKKIFYKIIKLPILTIIKSALMIILSLMSMALLSVLLIWIEKNISDYLKKVLTIFIYSIILIPFSISFLMGIYYYLCDRNNFKKIIITNKISRQEIAKIITSLKSPKFRLAVVRRLAELKTNATGNWPDEFKLSVSSDEAITELAKLEEHWLKLDR